MADPAWAQTTTQMEFIGPSAGTSNYNVADNWNQLQQVGGTGLWLPADPHVHRVPANDQPTARRELAFIRSGATVTLVNSVPHISGLDIGVAGDVTKDAGGTIQPRSGSTLEIRSGGNVLLTDYPGSGPARHTTTVGANYDGTLTIDGGNFTDYGAMVVGGRGSANPDGLIPYQGTGRLNVRSGNFAAGYYLGGTYFQLYIGSGRTSDTAGRRCTGIANFSGGNVSIRADSGLTVGNNGGKGSLTVSGEDTYVDSTDAYLYVGAPGYYGNVGGTVGYHERSEGTYIQNGGQVDARGIMIGQSHADGYFELNGGGFIVTGETESRVGQGGGRKIPGSNPEAGWLTTGVGSLVVNGGYFQSNNTKTKFIIGKGSTDESGSGYFGPGIGVFLIRDGTVEFNRGGDAVDNSIEVGHNGGGNSYSYGELSVLGGTLFVNKRIVLAKNETTTGILRVSKDAVVTLGWLGCWVDGEAIPTNHMPKIIVDVTGTGHSLITVYQDLWLKGTLDVQTYGYRPREGDPTKIIDLNESLSSITGDFEVFTSNITNGLPTDPLDPNVTLSAFLGIPVAGDPNNPPPDAAYSVTFRGYTYGDANGDHKVDGTDLALMGGAWLKTGQTWGTCEFSGDLSGLVDGSDLALLGGNWMWVKPSPTAPSPDVALPEPATLALLALGGTVLVRRRR
ncbi:MAG: PEP-CTERM sorting domain-containing protein [Phycisphaerae bacterium]|nr:PEP-CTERM sorting domain-containing protein [Phycisphaerae bacterium]